MRTRLLAAAVALLAISPALPAADPPFVVHEWGTFTSVQGHDGKQVWWLPNRKTDLPGFVYSRGVENGGIRGVQLLRGKDTQSGILRMETPVIYFYSDVERAVDVRVRLPKGEITEWYPQATRIGPSYQPDGSGPSLEDSLIEWKGVTILLATYNRFPLTTLLYVCIFAHSVVLMVGGAYTYARVPFGFEMQELLGLARNPYDKIGHFMQGFVPALVAREILLRGQFVRGRRMLAFLCVCIVMAISSVYELIEWWVALAAGQGAVEFLGTQGDPWDTQSDMLFALIGAVSALLLLSRLQDRQIRAQGLS
jgi:putative membrane protein